MTLTRRDILAGSAALAATTGTASAQTWPAKPIRWIVPFPPGGNLDITARVVSEVMSKELGQTIVIDNRAGAGGGIGVEMAANAPADGYTIVISATGTMFVVPLWAEKKAFTFASFAPVAMLTVVPLLIVVPANSRFKDARSFLDYARANPGKVSVGHAGVGTTNHIALLRVQAAEKIEFNVIPYKGSGPGLNDVVAGQIDAYTDQMSSSSPQIKGGRLRALLVLSKDRLAEAPDVPTLAELGHPGLDCVTPAGVFVPAATPAPVIATLNAAVNKALADENVRKRYAEIGSIPRPMSPKEFDAFLRVEETAINDLAKTGVLKPD